MRELDTPAGREMLRRHPDLAADEVAEVERQARGLGLRADAARRSRVLDGIRHLLTDEQRAAVSVVLLLDPDTVASLGDGKLRLILGGLADPRLTPSLDQEAGNAAREEARRFLDEIK